MKRKFVTLSSAVIICAAGAAGCGGQTSDRDAAYPTAEPEREMNPADEMTPAGDPVRAEAQLTAAEGAEVAGKATFVEEPDGVRVVLELDEAPSGKKGVHVHLRGDCSDITGESMGPHFAPDSEQHALPTEGSDRHLGDLGNIEVQDGKGRLEIKIPEATLGADDATTFLGRALVVHSGEDTGSTQQPSGGSGTPMACGVIQKVQG